MNKLRRFVKTTLVQQLAAWITIAGFVYFVVNKGMKVMLSQPMLFVIFIGLGGIASCLIFSIHAYIRVTRQGKNGEILDNYVENLKNSNDRIESQVETLRDWMKSQAKEIRKEISDTMDGHENEITKIGNDYKAKTERIDDQVKEIKKEVSLCVEWIEQQKKIEEEAKEAERKRNDEETAFNVSAELLDLEKEIEDCQTLNSLTASEMNAKEERLKRLTEKANKLRKQRGR